VKWKREEADLGRLAEKQHGILTTAAGLVKPGGRLVYATCSLEPEENDDLVRAFLESHPAFRVDPPAGFPVAAGPDGIVRCLPHVHGTDGFTAVRLIRAPGP
jgi:16S rRNA (cytosine967-C5)-methyltransferase